jgi:hypothetical protein
MGLRVWNGGIRGMIRRKLGNANRSVELRQVIAFQMHGFGGWLWHAGSDHRRAWRWKNRRHGNVKSTIDPQASGGGWKIRLPCAARLSNP